MKKNTMYGMVDIKEIFERVYEGRQMPEEKKAESWELFIKTVEHRNIMHWEMRIKMFLGKARDPEYPGFEEKT